MKLSSLITKLQTITGAKIAASTKLVGNSGLGGNWELDATTGNLQTQPVFQAETLGKYRFTLAITAQDDQIFLNSNQWGSWGGPTDITANDNSDTPINKNSVDFNPNTPGIQRYFNNGLFAVSNWFYSWRNFAWGGTYPYTSWNQSGISGSFSVPYTVQNSAGETSNPATLKIEIKPYAAADYATASPNYPESIFVTNNDQGFIDPSTIDLNPSTNSQEKTFTVEGKGTFTVGNLGEVNFTSVPGFTGEVTIPYRVADRTQLFSNPANIKVDVVPDNKSPYVEKPVRSQMRQQGLALGNPFQFAENTYVDPDPDDTVTYEVSVVNGNWWNQGKYTRAGNGNYFYKLNPGATVNESPLPGWLKFDPETETFSMRRQDSQNLFSDFKVLKVTGKDPLGASVSEIIPISKYGSGVAVDDYIAGSEVFFDANKNGIKDGSEPSTTTNDEGEYDFGVDMMQFDTNANGQLDPSEGETVVVGGTDSGTGLVLETPLKATPDAGVVTLLTTVVVELVNQGLNVKTANEKLATTLGIPVDLPINLIDPIAITTSKEPGSKELLSAMTQVQNVVTQTAGLIDGASSLSMADSVNSIVSAIADKAKADQPLDLTKVEDVKPLVESAATKVKAADPNFNEQEVNIASSALAQVVAEANKRIDTAIETNTADPALIRQQVAVVQKVALGETTQDFKEVGEGTKTLDQVVAENTGAALDQQLKDAASTVPVKPIGPTPAPTPNPTPTPSPTPTPLPVVPAIPLPISAQTPTPTPDKLVVINGSSNSTVSPDLASGLPQNTALGDDLYLLTDGADTSIPPEAIGKQIFALSGNDSLQGTENAETYFGNQGNDSLNGGGGNDQLLGGKGTDTLDGGTGNDFTSGNNDNDVVLGSDGDDTLRGGKEDDSLFGGAGADLLNGDLGFDTLTGGTGNDVFAVANDPADPTNVQKSDLITDFQAGDLIDLPENLTYAGLTFEIVSVQLGSSSPVIATAIKTGNNYLATVLGATPDGLTGTIGLTSNVFI